MKKTYALAIERSHSIERIQGIPLMTLPQAQHWQSVSIAMNRPCLVINTESV